MIDRLETVVLTGKGGLMRRMDDLLNAVKLNDFLRKRDEETKNKQIVLKVLAVVGAIAAVAAVAYGVYRFFTPDYLEDFDDDFEDEFEARYTKYLIFRQIFCAYNDIFFSK